MKTKLEHNRKLYEYTGFGNARCPICKRFGDQDEADYISEPQTIYFDSYEYFVFLKCPNCGKRYYYGDGN